MTTKPVPIARDFPSQNISNRSDMTDGGETNNFCIASFKQRTTMAPPRERVGPLLVFSGHVGRIEKRTRFTLAGTEYEHANTEPQLAAGSVRRFELGTEQQVIAAVPLADGGTCEVHGYATHYNQDWVTVVWTDDNFHHVGCWIPAADVRRPAAGEWHGRYVSF
jgi:hypothetical protein